MRRLCLFTVLIGSILLTSCGGNDRRPRLAVDREKDGDRPARGGEKDRDRDRPSARGKEDDVKPSITRVSYPEDEVVATLPKAGKEERYEDALHRAIDLLADRKYPEALAALKEARDINDTGAVQREITKVENLIAQQEGAERAVDDVKSVLDDGKADEAARLAGEALSQYGGGEQAEELTRLKQQADAVLTAETDNAPARRAALRAEADAAVRDRNLRAAAVALEQLLALGADDGTRRELDGIRTLLKTYDDNLQLALDLRRDPARIEGALTYLTEAQKAWNTLQIQQEIDQCRLLMERRRDRLSVADFEVRGDVGEPGAGRTVSEELLGHFKPRYDLVERSQLNRIIAELKLDDDDLSDGSTGQELARLAKVRYLVVGSVSPLAGVTVQARLVEVRSGLVVQTARVSAPTVAALLPKLKQLAVMLQMNDADKFAYEEQLVKKVEAVQPIEAPPSFDDVRIDPVPPAPAPEAPPPPPLVTYTPRPPAPVVFNVIQPVFTAPVVYTPPPPPQPFAAVVVQRNPVLGRRLFALSLQLGDDCYRRGMFRDAQRHFSLALSIGGPRRELSIRLDRCRTYAPPPPPPRVVVPVPVVTRPIGIGPTPIIATPAPVVVAARPFRPRVAVFGFALNCPPTLVPSAASEVLAEQFAAYCRGSYDIIDRGEVSWYMGRLGITMREVMGDESARRALAHSLNARYFVFGAVHETASLDVETRLVDPESGKPVGAGKIHVQNAEEMKLRLGELAQQIGAKPEQQKELAARSVESEKAVTSARRLLAGKQPDKAVAVLEAAPKSVAVQTLLGEARRQRDRAASEARQRAEAEKQRAAVAAARKRQEELAAQAALARRRAEAAAKARTDAARKQQEAQKERAAASLRAQAKQAAARGDHQLAVQQYQSALNLKPDAATAQSLAEARVALQRSAKERQQAELKKRETAAEAQRKAALARVEKEKADRLNAEKARQAERTKQDQARHDALVKQANDLVAKKDYKGAVAAATAARRYRASDESNKLLERAEHELALIEAAKKGAAEKARVEKERKERETAELKVQKTREAYLAHMKKGQEALVGRKYEAATTEYEAAAKLFRTEAALSAVKNARELRDQERKLAAEQKRAGEIAAARSKKLKEAISQGNNLLAKKQHEKAVAAFREATKIDPDNVEAVAGLSRAEREYNAERTRVARENQLKTRPAAIARSLAAGNASLTKRQWADARKSFEEVLKLDPNNQVARKGLATALDRDPKTSQKEKDYLLSLEAGRNAMKAKNYAGAVNAYNSALKLKPGDEVALRERDEAVRLQKAGTPMDPKRGQYQKLIGDAQADVKAGRYAEAIATYDQALKLYPGDKVATDGRNQAVRLRANAAYEIWMDRGKAAMAAKKYADAEKAFDEALKVRPGDPDAVRGKREADAAGKKPAPAPVDRKKAQYDRLIEEARADAKASRFYEALTGFDQALKLYPGDRIATAERNAVKLRADASYTTWMQRGRTALAAKQYAEAEKAFDQALRIRPGDAEGVKGKRAADDGQKGPAPKPAAKPATSTSPSPAPSPAASTYARQMKLGQNLESARKYADAADAYEAALRAVRGDPAKDARLRTGQQAAWMGIARCEHAQRHFPEAVRAYEAVLRLVPTDARAKDGLARARAKRP